MVTLYDVARRAAVSTATVSRVVHGQDRVREATRIRVLQAIDELGYVPDGAGQSLSRRRKDIIGMVCIERGKAEQHDVETECLLYYDEVQRGVQARIRDSQWLLLSSFMQADGAGEPDLSRLNPLSGKVDGILAGEGFAASRYIQRLAARLPVVVIAGTLGAQAADVVAADNFSGATALITHLIADHGRRRLFHVGGPPNSPDALQRRLALDHALRSNPQCQLIGSVQGIFSVCSGEQAAEELLTRHRAELPDAVVCANDQMAIGVLRTFTAAGVRVLIRRSARSASRRACSASEPAPGCSTASPIRACPPQCSCCPPNSCCGQAAAARPARKPARRSRPSSTVKRTRRDGGS
jgi:LacI family transcriptional regulator